jgi:hypothetical protein
MEMDDPQTSRMLCYVYERNRAPVPMHHGFGRDRNEGFLPSEPESADGDAEEFVEQV